MRLRSVGCLALAPVLAAALQAQSRSHVFPMEKGTLWIYAGSVTSGQGEQAQETQLSWKAEVLDSVEDDRFSVALLRGDPRDLAWYGEHSERGCYLLTVLDEQEFYLHPLKSECALPPHDRFNDLLDPEDLFLRLPAQKGDSFGGDPEREQVAKDGLYAWCVEERKKVTFSDVKGVPRRRAFTAYVLGYRPHSSSSRRDCFRS
jgi:hypothetical protein